MRSLRLILFPAILAGVLSLPSFSEAESLEAFRTFARTLEGADAVRIEIEQRANNTFLGEDTVRKGTLLAQKPNFLRWEYKDEPKQLIIVDGEHVWFHEDGSNTVYKEPFSAGRYPVIIQALFGDVNAALTLFDAAFSEEDGLVQVTLTPKELSADLKSARFIFKPGEENYREIAFTDHYDQTSRLLPTNIDRSPRIPKKAFTFKLDKNMKVVSSGEATSP